MPVTTPSAGRSRRRRVREQAVLDEVLAAVVAQQRDAFAAEQLAGGGVALVVLGARRPRSRLVGSALKSSLRDMVEFYLSSEARAAASRRTRPAPRCGPRWPAPLRSRRPPAPAPRRAAAPTPPSMARLAAASASGPAAAISRPARRGLRAARPPAPRRTRCPSACARAASMRRPVRISSLARGHATDRASRCVPPAPGMMPRRTSVQPQLGALGRDAEVAGQRQLQPAAERGAVDRRDHRLREAPRARR